MEEFFILNLDPSFPLAEIQEIAAFLMGKNCLVPGYHPPNVGLLDVLAMHYSRDIEKQETIVLPDRNLVGRMAKIARDGIKLADEPTMIAVNLMAYCQCLNIQIEPSIAMYELAAHDGNQGALDELEWFRIADKANPMAWVERAFGSNTSPMSWSQTKKEVFDLEKPLHRWRRNYIVALKIAELELLDCQPKDRLFRLLDWIQSDFIVAGPAETLALFYFSLDAQRQGSFKRLRSKNRANALAGVRNEAWDIMQLSDFIRRVKEDQHCRFILASADTKLTALARDLFPENESQEQLEHFTRISHQWWPTVLADQIANKLMDSVNAAAGREARNFDPHLIDQMISDGEKKVIDYQPV